MAKRIMVVDDDKAVLDVVSRFLAKKGFNDVNTFLNPQLALEDFISKESIFILTDFDMPVMSGPDLVAKIKKRNSKVLCVGMSAEYKNEDAFYRVGCNAFLKKPFKVKDLEGVLKVLRLL